MIWYASRVNWNNTLQSIRITINGIRNHLIQFDLQCGHSFRCDTIQYGMKRHKRFDTESFDTIVGYSDYN